MRLPTGVRRLLQGRRGVAVPITLAGALLVAGLVAVVVVAPGPAPEPVQPAFAPSPRETHQESPSTGRTPDRIVESDYSVLESPPPPAHVERDGPIEYEVREGETLLVVAERFGLRAETLVWANDIEDADLIFAGQVLRIPPLDGLFYTVRPGDEVRFIAARFGLEIPEIVRANRLESADHLFPGTELFLPAARPLAPGLALAPSAADEVLEDLGVPPPNLSETLSAGWLRTTSEAVLFKTPGMGAVELHRLPSGARVERAGGLMGRRVLVRDPGDGLTRQAMTGWLDVFHVEPGAAPASWQLSRAYPDSTRMDIAHVFVPYRTQLDGSPWAGANCGPTALSMALAAFGIQRDTGQLRREVLAAQGIHGNNVGTLITALAAVGERHGIQPIGLYEGGAIKRWTLDDIRAQLWAGRPVVAQVHLRSLPGYESMAYFGDHYIVITGILGDGFLYNDTLNHDGPGWDRVISSERLARAMDARDQRFRFAAFAAAPA